MAVESLSKADYLKKYMSSDAEKSAKKKKKVPTNKGGLTIKKIPSTTRGIKIVDTDADFALKPPNSDDESDEELKPLVEAGEVPKPLERKYWKTIGDDDEEPPSASHDSGNDSPRRRHDSNDSAASEPRTTGADLSPPRRSVRRSPSPTDLSPKRKGGDLSPPRRSGGDLSPKRKGARDESPPPTSAKMAKTLSGAKAGLQRAADMREEAKALKRREEEMFSKLTDDVSGRSAKATVRELDRRGKKKKREPTEEEKKRLLEVEEKYKKWNKGLKQLEQQKERVAEVLHEIEKPVARYKDDVDMNEMLRQQELKEDPMFAYMQKKREQAEIAANTSAGRAHVVYPKYKGPAAPENRFGIAPGYRWDGVNRSNGFEARLLSIDNTRKADAQDLYTWNYAHFE